MVSPDPLEIYWTVMAYFHEWETVTNLLWDIWIWDVEY